MADPWQLRIRQLRKGLSRFRRGADRKQNETRRAPAGSIAFARPPSDTGARPLHAAELQPDTLTAWNTCLKNADLHVQERVEGRRPFLWVDESHDRAARVRNGEVVVASVVGKAQRLCLMA